VTIHDSSEIAPTCHVGRQHDDAGAHHVDGDDERELGQVHLFLWGCCHDIFS